METFPLLHGFIIESFLRYIVKETGVFNRNKMFPLNLINKGGNGVSLFVSFLGLFNPF